MVFFVDISSYNTVDWTTYRAWSGMVAIKSSEGVGFTDSVFASHRAGALAVGINSIWYYHFGKPDLGNDPVAEANWQYQVVGSIRPQDRVVLDFEVADPQATAEWAYQFLLRQEANYGQLPVIYASTSFVLQTLQDTRLARYPLWLADWTHDPTIRPLCPSPWASYAAIQYTDQATGIPGIAEAVDADIFFLGGAMIVPTGWGYDPNTGILTAPGAVQHTVRLGNAKFVLMWPGGWPTGNIPLEEEHGASGGGTEQTFQNCKLAWNSKDGVHIAPLGTQYLAALAQITTLQLQLSLLNSGTINQAITQINAALAQMQQHTNLVSADIAAVQAALEAITLSTR